MLGYATWLQVERLHTAYANAPLGQQGIASPRLLGYHHAGRTLLFNTQSPTAHREAETAKAHRG